MSLHILQLGPYPPPEGGVSRNILAIRDEVRARGHRCSIIATAKSNNWSAEIGVYHPPSAIALLRLMSSLKYDVLHLHLGGGLSPRVLSLVFACAFFGRDKSVLTVHSGGFPVTDAARRASPRSIRGRIFRRFSSIVAVNDAIADVFERFGIASDRIKVIEPYSLRCPDVNIAVPGELADFFARHSPMLISVGGLEKDYDPLFQIAAMEDILAEFPNAGLMIVGGGSMRDRVEAAIATSRYAKNIFLAGDTEHSITLHLISNADILLRTTLFDGDAISVREALFLGTAVIATETGMRPEGVELIGAGNVYELVRKIEKVMLAGKQDRPAFLRDDTNKNIKKIVDLYEALA